MQLDYQNEPGRIFAVDHGGRLMAEIRFPMAKDGLVHFTSTFVAPSLRGQGIGDYLVRAAIDEIRKRGVKAVAICSYVRSWLDKHPEAADILADAD